MGRAGRLVVVAVLAFLALGGDEARAATAEFQEGGSPGERGAGGARVLVEGEPGERNDLTVVQDGDEIVVSDAAAPLRPGGRCVVEGQAIVRCPAARVLVNLGGGDDRLVVRSGFSVRASGDEGDDVLDGSANLLGGPETMW